MKTDPRRKLSTTMVVILAATYVLITGAVVGIVNSFERAEALEKAHASAERMIERNLSIHRYFAKELKPSVFALAGDTLPSGYFDPRWMSSTHAIRIMQGYLEKANKEGLYYKECAIDARSPENEADVFEREFLERSAKDPAVTGWSGVREIEGRPYFVVLRRGESMAEECLLCHSDPSRAPKGLVARFGDERSFHREAGDLVSALSVRIPLADAYARSREESKKLVLSISGMLALTLVLLFFLLRAYVGRPLAHLRAAVGHAARDAALLGQPIETGGSVEIQEVADAFAQMSSRVKNHVVELESEVEKRTQHLAEMNEKLLGEVEERRRAEAALSASETRYRSLFANMTEAFALHEAVLDSGGRMVDYRFLDVNPAFEKETGLPREQVVGRTQRTLLPDEDAFWVDTYGKLVLGGAPVHLTHYSAVLRKHYEVHAFRTGPLLFAVLFRDVTEQKALEEQLRQSQKLEAIGTLAGGIAHDFNNILGAIMGFTELSLMKLPSGHAVRENLQEVLVASTRAKELVRQILSVGRRGARKRVPVEVHRIVTEAMKFLGSVIPKTVSVEQQVDTGAAFVLADPTELHQVVMNLCTNAYQAMSETGGTLRVTLAGASVGPQEASAVPGLVPGDYLRLEVEDTGEGMDGDALSKIFEPYFTTKTKGRTKGTGLGLAVVQSIVVGLKGAVSVRSTPGLGTLFVVYLPKHAPGEGEVPEATPPEVRGGSGSVLFVDDEPGLARLGKKMLESLGYAVRDLSDPLEAIRIFESDPTGFDVIVTDQTMPGLTGADLVRRARAVRPGMPAVMCTGYSDLIDEKGSKEQGIAAFVQKPYDRNRLGAAVAAALGKGS